MRTTFALSDQFDVEPGRVWVGNGQLAMTQVIGDFNGDERQDVTAAFVDYDTGQSTPISISG